MAINIFNQGGLKVQGVETEFDAEHAQYLRDNPEEMFLYYDDVPRTVELHCALMYGDCHIEMDYDRVGNSKTGFVFRVGGKRTKRTWPHEVAGE